MARSNHTQWDTEIGSFKFPPVEFTNFVGGTTAGGSLKINSNQTVNSGSTIRLGMGSSNNEMTLAQGSGNQDRFVNTNGVPLAKHINWDQAASAYLLNNSFTVSGTPGETETAYFIALNPGTITASSVDGANISGMKLSLDDLWYLNQDGSQNNHFAQATIPITQSSSPMTGAYNQGTGGVFLNQGDPPHWDQPYYSVGFPTGQTISVGGTNHQLYLVNWTASGATIQNSTANQTGVEFTSSNATLIANVKGMQLSNDPSAYANNSQRKLVSTTVGTQKFLHQVYTSAGHVWYEFSTDNGTTWNPAVDHWGNTYGPLDGTAGGKCPSIDWDPATENVVIVWQQASGNYYSIQYNTFQPVAGTSYYGFNSYGDLYNEQVDSYSSVNANPNIAICVNKIWILTLERLNQDPNHVVFPGISELCGTFDGNVLNGVDQYGQSIPTLIMGTNSNSVNATIYGNKTLAGGFNGTYWLFPLAWEQETNRGSDVQSQIKYSELLINDNSSSVWLNSPQNSPTQLSSSTVLNNYHPSIIGLPTNVWAISWIQDFTGYGNPSSVYLAYRNGATSTMWSYGSNPQSCTINISNDNLGAYFAWSQVWNGVWSSKVVNIGNVNFVGTIGGSGQDIQLSNGLGKINMYENSFYRSTAPYYFSPAISLNNVSGLSLVSPGTTSNTRGIYVGDDNAQLLYSIGDITVDGTNVPFVSIPDTFKSTTIADINALLVTQPFPLTANSKVVFAERTSMADSAAVAGMLGDSGYVSFTIELLDASSNNLVGTIKQTRYVGGNLGKYSQSAFTLNTLGVSVKSVKIRLTARTNITNPKAYPMDGYSSESMTAASSPQSLKFQLLELIKDYTLDQNFPNPFNPTTIISYTIPKDGMVTLKIFDALGREVETLVNERQTVGRYSVNFDASRLSSGVYFYRLVSGNYVSTKKMLLMK